MVHHLKHAIQDEANIIAIVGFQARTYPGTGGWLKAGMSCRCSASPRRGAPAVVFNGLSAHADRNDLLAYVERLILRLSRFCGPRRRKQALSLAAAIQIVVPHKESPRLRHRRHLR